jgi:ketosteroid isomerase-like protein
MSEENVEMARRGYEAYNRGDFDAAVADFAPTFEYVTTGAIPGITGVYRGPEGWKDFVGWTWSEFESPRFEVHELIDTASHVLASVTLRGRGKQSGVVVTWDLWHLWTVRDGQVVRGQAFTRRDDALKAAGLRE